VSQNQASLLTCDGRCAVLLLGETQQPQCGDWSLCWASWSAETSSDFCSVGSWSHSRTQLAGDPHFLLGLRLAWQVLTSQVFLSS
jgi:hypothetical protein